MHCALLSRASVIVILGERLPQVVRRHELPRQGRQQPQRNRGARGSRRISGATYTAGSDVHGAWIEGQFPTSITNALVQMETRTYDPRFGGIVTLTDPNTLPTRWTHDSFGRKQSEARADGTVTNWFYERCADVPGACPSGAQYRVRVTATGAPTSNTYYDILNREIRTETQGFDGTLVRKDTAYNARGLVSRVSRPYYVGASPISTFLDYDTLGRVISARELHSTEYIWSRTTYNGLITTVTTTAGNPGPIRQKLTTTKNSQGQVVQVKDIQNNTLTYTYDEFGNLKTTTDALGNVTTLSYDLRGRKAQMIDPDMGTWTYGYNAASDLVRQRDAIGQQTGQDTTMIYDPLGRMTNRSEPDLVSTWSYDNCTMGIGKLCQASATNGYSRTHSYDEFGRPRILAASIDTSYAVTTTYVASGIHTGKIDTLTYPTGFSVKYIYNSLGYVREVGVFNPSANPAFAADGTLLWRVNAMSANGVVTNELLGTNLTQTRTLDELDRFVSVVASGPSGTVHSLFYGYDYFGLVSQRLDYVNGLNEAFSYDNLNRLKMASGTGPTGPLITRSFDYNAIGNMTYKSDVGTYTYPVSGAGSARPHAVSSVSGPVNAAYGYDANGNLLSGAGRTLTYTSFNLPLTISGSAATYTYTYTYSPEHERVKLITQLATGTQTSIYLHPGGTETLFYEKEIKSDATLEHKHYVQAGTQLVGVYVTKSTYVSGDGPQMRYYHSDSLGSIMAISNEAGARIEALAYEPFGKRRFPNGTADPNNTLFGITTDRGFTEHEHLDEVGLIHMNGRVYDPLLGRFMTPDPGVPHPADMQSFNRYSYTRNNPLARTDPSGFCDPSTGEGCTEAPPSIDLSQLLNPLASLWNMLTGGIFSGGLSSSEASFANGTQSTVIPVGLQTPDGQSSNLNLKASPTSLGESGNSDFSQSTQFNEIGQPGFRDQINLTINATDAPPAEGRLVLAANTDGRCSPTSGCAFGGGGGGGGTRFIDGARVESYGREIGKGTIDLKPTIDRINSGVALPYRNDGSVFKNYGEPLPAKPAGYYREYVVPTPGIEGAGPQRIIRGNGGEIYYTPNHYKSFIPVY